MTISPAELGYFERRPGSGTWYRLSGPGRTVKYAPATCENCGREFMGERRDGRGRFCSAACTGLSQRRLDVTTLSYRALHKRVELARGKAPGHACADCGGQAAQWSQVHGTTGQEPGHYRPLCRTCHRAYDAASLARGERHGSARLAEAQVREILWSRASQRELAARYGHSPSTISSIRNRKIWRHVAYHAA
jgi:hypothetical protein